MYYKTKQKELKVYMDKLNELKIEFLEHENLSLNDFSFNKNYDNEFISYKENILKLKNNIDISKIHMLNIKGLGSFKINLRHVFDTKEFNELYFYPHNDLGANYNRDYTTFKLWAPTAQSVELILYNRKVVPMEKSEKGTWEVTVKGDLHNQLYNYLIDLETTKNIVVDPYAKGVGLNGNTGAVINFDRLNPKGWDKYYKTDFSKINNAIFYELSVRDITYDKSSKVKHNAKFLGLAEYNKNIDTGLSYIKNLGITHIQLMPIFDFETIDERNPTGRYNWGYDPENYNALDGSYSTNPNDPSCRIKEFKEMILAIHKRDLKVTMDVVFNHVYNKNTMSFNNILPDYYFRKKENGEFADGSGCGNEIATERKMVRKFILDSILFYTKEYKMDGFRFDLMGLMDIETMNLIREKLDEIDPSITMIGEGWNLGEVLDEHRKANLKNISKLKNIAQFNGYTRDGINGSYFDEKEKGFVSGNFEKKSDVQFGILGSVNYNGNFNYLDNSSPNQIVNYVEAHDDYTLFDKLKLSNPDKNESSIKDMHKLATSIILLSQGIPFIHSGQEFMRTKNLIGNTYNLSDEINKIDWNLKNENQELVDYFKEIIKLRKKHPAFRCDTKEKINKYLNFLDTNDSVIAYNLSDFANGDLWSNIVVIHNASSKQQKIKLPKEGKWNVVVNKNKASYEKFFSFNGKNVLVEPISTKILYLSTI
ncbi:MAG: type I pullulanase [Bacillota bacterium]